MPYSIKSKACFLLLLSLLSLIPVNLAHATDRKILWPRWQVNDPLSKETINHQAWQQFLTHNVITNEEQINLINYRAITPADKQLLIDYLIQLSQIPISRYNRDEQLAYWLNLYNALTVQLILEHFPVSSIQDINISPGLFSIGPWSAHLIRVENIALSLNDIHNRIVRPIWNDPRTHYAINNASIGAPNLPKRAYLGNRIKQQLNQAAFDYINCLRGLQIIDNTLVVSKIYDWFEQDFGGTKQFVIQHLLTYANDKTKEQLQQIHTIDGYLYNWHLNSAINGTQQSQDKKN